MKNKIIFGQDMTDALKAGMDKVHRAVSATIGAAGRNSLYRSGYSMKPMVTNDGISIARRIVLEDEAEALGAELITQAAERTDEEAGDGTTTAIILTHGMIERGLEKIKNGTNPMALRKQMQDSAAAIISLLKKESIEIKTDEQLFDIANISMENKEVAKVIAEATKKVGQDGVVLVEESRGMTLEREDIDGIKFDKGYISPYMATNPNTMDAVLKDVDVLVTDKSFNLNRDILPLIEELHKRKSQYLFMVCGGINGEILQTLIANRLQGKFICVAVEKPFDENVLEDIAVLTGAENITETKHSGGLVPLHINSLGKARKIVVTKDSTIIVGGGGSKEKVDERVSVIKKEIKETESPFEKGRLKERLAKLTGGMVILKVGAPTEAEMKYLKLKVDDAVASTKAALEEGVVIGGGKTLYNLSLGETLNDGDEVIKYACSLPMTKIIENAGWTGFLQKDEVFNALTGRVTSNPIEDGIIDPVKVERCALQNAVSLASTFLTTESAIIEIPEKAENVV